MDQYRSARHDEYLTAAEAARLLGVKRETLYAYTSRGRIQSIPGGHGPARRYRRADLERLRARSAAQRGEAALETSALRFGEPILESSVTWLTEDGPIYRGHPAVSLAANDRAFEAVAELLWSGELPREPPLWDAPTAPPGLFELASAAGEHPSLLAMLALENSLLACLDSNRFDTRPKSVLPRARTLIRQLAAGTALAEHPERVAIALAAPTVAESLAIALGARQTRPAIAALDRALVLLADHELNASTFAARVAASTQADVYACVGAGLATLQGPKHGAASQLVAAFVAEIGLPERTTEAVQRRMQRGDRLPGFGHSVYTQRDPRTQPLLDSARALAPQNRTVQIVLRLVDEMQRQERPPANVDTALVALGAGLGLPAPSLPAIFGIARIAGWVAHALEQYEGPLLRPRARYRNPQQATG